jgi:hypothetical protein
MKKSAEIGGFFLTYTLLTIISIKPSASHADRLEEYGDKYEYDRKHAREGLALAYSVCDKAKNTRAKTEEHQHAAGVKNAGYREDINDGKDSVKNCNCHCLPKLESDGAENYIKRTADDGKYRRDEALFSCYKHRAEDDTAKRRHQKLDQKVKK